MFVILEGIDGCGKSTVAEALKNKVPNSIVVHAPTAAAKERACSKKSKASFLFIMLEDMVDILQTTIIPALLEGKSVIMDRFWPSTVVYQTQQINEFLCMPEEDVAEMTAKALGIALMESMHGNDDAVDDILSKNEMNIVVLDTPVETAMSRIKIRNNQDVFDNVPREVMEKRRASYLSLGKHKENYHVISTDGKSVDEIVEEILKEVA